MSDRAAYHHPALDPYSTASWKDIAVSWALAATLAAALLIRL